MKYHCERGAVSPYVWAVAYLVFCVFAGCDDRRLDLRNIEGAIKDRYGHGSPVAISSVTCPESVRTREGDTFDCTLIFEGGEVWSITVTQLGAGRTSWTPRGRAVFADDVEPWLAAAIEGEGARMQVQCSQRVYVVEPGEAITCSVVTTSRSSVRRVAIDAAGTLHLIDAPSKAEREPGETPR